MEGKRMTEQINRFWVLFDTQKWESLHDEEGKELPDILGKTGAVAMGSDGVEVGLDLIDMNGYAQFPQHIHQGDHMLYCLSGKGAVQIGKMKYLFEPGRSIYIDASIPHNVIAWSEGLTFLAWGHPHKHVAATDRMQLVKEEPV
jgi:quercetin dioxygenase-like cupin family protein